MSRLDQAVGVEDHHVVVARAPALDEVLQVAGLAADVLASGAGTRPASRRASASRSASDGQRLAYPGIGARANRTAARSRSPSAAPCVDQLLGHRAHRHRRAQRILVVDRHHQRRAGRRGRARVAEGASGRRRCGSRPATAEPAAWAIQPSVAAKKTIMQRLQDGHVLVAHDRDHLGRCRRRGCRACRRSRRMRAKRDAQARTTASKRRCRREHADPASASRSGAAGGIAPKRAARVGEACRSWPSIDTARSR